MITVTTLKRPMAPRRGQAVILSVSNVQRTRRGGTSFLAKSETLYDRRRKAAHTTVAPPVYGKDYVDGLTMQCRIAYGGSAF